MIETCVVKLEYCQQDLEFGHSYDLFRKLREKDVLLSTFFAAVFQNKSLTNLELK